MWVNAADRLFAVELEVPDGKIVRQVDVVTMDAQADHEGEIGQ